MRPERHEKHAGGVVITTADVNPRRLWILFPLLLSLVVGPLLTPPPLAASGPSATLTAAFSANVTSGAASLAVQFTDLSSGNATAWLWDFGDGQTSIEQNPAHDYAVDGLYTVSLRVMDGAVSDTLRKVDFIRVGGTLVTANTTLQTGWNMVSFPLAPESSDFNDVLGDDISAGLYTYWYDPDQGRYQMWSPQDPGVPVERGRGYWIKAASPIPIDAGGYVDSSRPFSLHLKPGWNMIGHPFELSVNWNDAKVSYQGATISITQAHDNNWVMKYIYSYDSSQGAYDMMTAPEGMLQPWKGYWVKALVEADLVIQLPEWWTTYTNAKGITSLTLEGNKLWAGSFTGALMFDPASQVYVKYTTSNSGLAGNRVNAVTVDAEGNKWFGTQGGGVSRFDDTAWTTYTSSNSGLTSNYVNSIAIGNAGTIWFSTEGGASKFDGSGWTTYRTSNSGIVSDQVVAIRTDTAGNLWFGTRNGVSKFDGIAWTTYTVDSGLASNYINTIAIDSAGNKWFGTSGGVSEFDGTEWTTYNRSNSGITDDSVSAITTDSQGNKWFGTMNGVSKFDGIAWTTYKDSNSGVASDYVTAITIDGAGNLWFGTSEGVSRLDGSK